MSLHRRVLPSSILRLLSRRTHYWEPNLPRQFQISLTAQFSSTMTRSETKAAEKLSLLGASFS